jgi:hypothetical protein
MGAALLTLAVASSLSLAPQDTLPTYANPATRALVERAVARREAQDTTVADYRARLDYRIRGTLGRRWGLRTPIAAEQQAMVVYWHRPNDLRVDVVGRRSVTPTERRGFETIFQRPWFVPRGVDDSVRIFSNRFPASGALHPLARSAPGWYRYALVDSLRISVPGAGALRIYGVEVRPKRAGPALVAGRLWIDSASAEVVRWTFRYVGSELWTNPEQENGDSSDARRVNALVSRIVTIDVDLEYGLQERRYWMPRRQTLSGTVHAPIVNDLSATFEAVTTFDDYAINTGQPVPFAFAPADTADPRTELDSAINVRRSLPDSLRPRTFIGQWAGGRFEIHRASPDSLSHYAAWEDTLRLELTPDDRRRITEARADLARLVEELPDELTGQRPHAFAYEQIVDVARYNRVQGLSLGLGYRLRMPMRFTQLYGTVRYGFSDERVTGRLALVRDAPEWRMTLSGYRDVLDADPFSRSRNIGSSLNALFTGHDNADYHLALGGRLGWEVPLSVGTGLRLHATVERQESVEAEARSAVNDWLGDDGRFPDNPAIEEGTFAGGGAQLTGVGRVSWTLAGDVLGGEAATTGRVWGELRTSIGAVRGATLRVKAGAATSPTLPQQAFRAGGLNTVRGFDYGIQRGAGLWAAQLDVSLLGGGGIRPVVFVDAGRSGPVDELFEGEVLVGGGVGVSLYSSLLRTALIRIDVSRAITPEPTRKLRLDLTFQAPR